MKRSERLFALAEAMRARRTGITAAALAERFGVSVRTVLRDLDALRAAHVPITGERGRGGGLVLDKSYAMPPVSFSAREALLLLVLERYARELRVMPFLDTLSSALDKVRAALPPESQRQLARIERTISFVGVPQKPVPRAVRDAVEHALFEGAALLVDYEKADGSSSQRRVRVENIVLERTETLLNCTDLELGERRQFRLHRLRSARVIADAPHGASDG